jgi:hypothetical protein
MRLKASGSGPDGVRFGTFEAELEADFFPLVGFLIAGFFAVPDSSALGSGLLVFVGVLTTGSK